MPTWNVREGTVADAPEIVRLFNSGRDKNFLCCPTTSLPEWSVERAQRTLKDAITTVLERDGKIVGFTVSQRFTSPNDRAEFLNAGIDYQVITNPKEQLAITQRLVSSWLQHLFMAGINTLVVDVYSKTALGPHVVFSNPSLKAILHRQKGNKVPDILEMDIEASMQWFIRKGL